ncbi:hypothetical protein [Desulfocurvibacter africanus]|uniref:hypothetical protein n=1 Tax=Desulfocurvibacter africanus TaxID=873 RepID=UPI001FCABCA9|nr:hypothetical protein [Desulfocurvibacter africanus]
MPKLLLALAIFAGLLLQAGPSSGQDCGLRLDAGIARGGEELRIPLAAVTFLDTPAPELRALPGLPPGWAQHPAINALPHQDTLSMSFAQTYLPCNTGITFMPYVGGWAAPLDWYAESDSLAPGDQSGARFAWNFGGGIVWFFRDVLGVDFGLRWTEKDVRVSSDGLRIGDIRTHGKLNLQEQSVHVNVSMPLR